MKLDFSKKILGVKGEAIKQQDETDMTLGGVTANALLSVFDSERNLDGASKAKRFKLAMRVIDGGEQDLQVEEVAEIKKVIALAYGPLIVGRAYEIIEA